MCKCEQRVQRCEELRSDDQKKCDDLMQERHDFYGGMTIEEVHDKQHGLWTTWLRMAAQLGPITFMCVTGMIISAILALRDVTSQAPYIVVASLCVFGLVAGILTRGKDGEAGK